MAISAQRTFSILISPERLVLLDCEAAWFGDPAFDAAFLLNHLFLKALHLPAWLREWRDDSL